MCQAVIKDLHDHSVQLNRWFLKPLGAWPRSATTSKGERALSYILIFICFFLIAFTAVPCALNILYEERDIQLKLMAIGPLSHWIMGAMNYCSLLLRSADIRGCVQHMQRDWQIIKRTRDREIMARNAQLGRLVAGFCAVFMHGGLFSYTIVCAMTTVVVPIGDNRSVEMIQLPVPSYSKFIDARFSPANEIMLMTQMLSTFVVNSTTVGACSLAAVFTMHACGQLDILMTRLNRLVEGEDARTSGSLQRRLADIVDHHLRVLSFIARIEDGMHQICLVELLGCTFNMCMTGYHTITKWGDSDAVRITTFCIIYVSMAINIFIFCYTGEILTEQCKTVGEKTYMTDWYNLPHKTARGLLLIIARSSNVIKITGGKLFQLSIATFSDVIKTSVIYLNLIRTMTST
ncbi:ObirOr5-L16 [Ooceraea biroi]|uniref:Odorant receptor n=1 Tax=Ooceraea biroi TaxID=2015173 RepID=A0A3L8D6X8_OOCBI|nr:ObirOr5-L16 [Ooceraea biroi]